MSYSHRTGSEAVGLRQTNSGRWESAFRVILLRVQHHLYAIFLFIFEDIVAVGGFIDW
jgi:hypothetical protein